MIAMMWLPVYMFGGFIIGMLAGILSVYKLLQKERAVVKGEWKYTCEVVKE